MYVNYMVPMTDTGPFRNSISQGIKNQQQHFEMMAMAEEAVRLFAEISHPETLPDTMTFVKVTQGQNS